MSRSASPPGDTRAMLRLLLDPAWIADGTVQAVPATVPGALLVLLATEGAWQARPQLATLFWPDAAPEDARHHLRIQLHRVRQMLAGWGVADSLEADRHRVRLVLPTDLAPLDGSAAPASAPRPDAQHPGTWLRGWDLAGYTGFQTWRSTAQRRLLARWHTAADAEMAASAPPRAPGAAFVSAMGAGSAAATTPGAAADATLPGRAADLARLRDAPQPAVVVLGEPGAGKSTLLAVAYPHSPVLRGLRGLDRLPYRPVLDALRQHTPALQRALADPYSRLRPYRLDLARLMPELAPDEALPPLDALTARSRLTEALVRAFEGLAPVLVVDDLQWCDGATLEWLALLAHDGRLRWRAAARSNALGVAAETLLSDLGLAGCLHTLRLAPLPREALADVCAWQGGGAGWSPADLDRLHTLGGGNPFLIGELLRVPGLAGGAAEGAPPLHGDIQAEVARLVQRRLQALPDAAAQAVQMACIFQQAMPAAALAPRAGAQALLACEAARAAGLLRALPVATGMPGAPGPHVGAHLPAADVADHPATSAPPTGWACAHDLVRDAVLAALPAKGLRALHRQAALWLGAQEQPVPDALVIAHHWAQAGEAQTSLAWLHRGAQQLKERGRFDEARERWQQVAAGSLDAAQALRARLELAACDLFDDLARGEAALRGVVAQLHAVADIQARHLLEARVLTALVDNRVFAGDIAAARGHAARLRTLLPTVTVHDQVEAHEVLIELAMREPDIPAAWASLGALRQLAPRRPSLLSFEGQIHWFGGEVQPAFDALDRLLARHPEYCSGMTIENDLAVMLHALGRVPEALAMVRRSLVSWAGVPHTEALSRLVLGVVLISAGGLDEAEDALQRALALARAQNSPGFEAEALVRLARLHLAAGRAPAAQSMLDQAAAFIADSPEPLRVSQWLWAATLCAEACGAPPPADALPRLQALAARSQHLLVHLRLARVRWAAARAAGDRAAASGAAADMATWAGRGPLPESQAEACRLAALTAAPAEAAACRARAQDLAQRGGFVLPAVPDWPTGAGRDGPAAAGGTQPAAPAQ